MKHEELNIPNKLGRCILGDGKGASFRVWIAAKGIHGSHCKVDELQHDYIAELSGLNSKQAVSYHIDKLLEWNWIGTDGERYFFRPVKYLKQVYGVSDKANNYKIDIKKELKDIKAVLFFMSVKAVIAYRRFVESTNGDHQQADANGYTLQYYKTNDLSVRLLSKLIGITQNMVHRLKHYAEKLGYITIRKNVRPVLNWERSYLFDNYYDHLFKQNEIIKLRMTDTIKTYV